MATPRKLVFLSYAHKDRKWADELRTFLEPWIREKRVALWDDSQIPAGDLWRKSIQEAIEEAKVAVLLITKDFLASRFIIETELPLILDRANQGQLRVLPVMVGPAEIHLTPLASIQAANDLARPLKELRGSQRDQAWVDIAKTIAKSVTLGAFAGGLYIVDQTTEPLEAALERRPEKPDRTLDVEARYDPADGRIRFTGSSETILLADLDQLSRQDQEFIADLNDSLERNYQRWRKVRTNLGDAGGSLDEEIEAQLARIAKLMCRDLNDILEFLGKMLKGGLQDHYSRYRFICKGQFPDVW